MTSADYIAKINQVKTGYLDGKWNAVSGQYESNDGYGLIAYTWLNIFLVQTIAILAGQGEASATDIARAQTVIAKLISSPCYTGNTWTHYMNGTSDKHAAVDQTVAECLYYCWKYRTELSLDAGTISTIYTILTVNASHGTTAIYERGAGPYNSHIINSNTISNQVTAKWKVNRLTYAVLAGETSWGADISTLVKRFVQYIDTNNPSDGVPNLFADFGWMYTPVTSGAFPSGEYGQMSLGGLLIHLPEIWSYLSLTADEIAQLKAWQRHLVGQWQMDGYLNWDSIWSSGRMHYLSYWLWSLRALSGMVRGTNLLQNSNDALYAKYILDQAIETYASMDTLQSDPADYAVDSYHFGVRDDSIYGQIYNNPKSSPNAKFVMELALAVEFGVADAASQAPPNLWTWGWDKKHIHVSTPNYSAASLPYAPVITGGFTGMDAVQLQHWGVSHIQAPRNIWLTGFGGYGLEAFSFSIKRNWVSEIDTSVDVPTTQWVYLDGVDQTRASYDTIVIPDTFSSTLRSYCAKDGANYKAEVITVFHNDHIRTTHRAILTGTAGGGIVVHSFPCRKNMIMEYVPVSGAKTVVWNGTTVTPAGSPDPSACKYIHLKWAQWNKGIILIPVSGVVATGAKVTALSYGPNGYPKRQPDQDRSLLIYLADGAASMGDVSLTYDIYFTYGTDADAQRVYGRIYTTAGLMADIRKTDGSKAVIYRV